jgi:hypothetical protein
MPAPHVPKDLSLAPVAVGIDANLQRFRDLERNALILELELELDRPGVNLTEEERRSRVLDAAVRNVNLHGWTAVISEDGARVRLDGGSVSLEVGLSATILDYIRNG